MKNGGREPKKVYRMDKTGVLLNHWRAYDEFECVENNDLEVTNVVYSVFDKVYEAFDYRIPLTRECSYLVLIYHTEGTLKVYKFNEIYKEFNKWHLDYVLLYSFPRDFFHVFKEIFTSDLAGVKQYESEVGELEKSLSSLNTTVQQLLVHKQQLSILIKSLEKSIVDAEGKISEYKALINDLELRKEKLSQQLNSLIEENSRLKAEKNFWATVWQVSIVTLLLSIIVSAVIAYKTAKYAIIFLNNLILVLSSMLFVKVNASTVILADKKTYSIQ